MKFIISIDTEGDNQWDHGRELTVENIKFVPRFQELCEKYGIKPTYFVTSEICDDAFAREIFTGYLRSGKAEIGSHLHSWTTPPFFDQPGLRYNDPVHAFVTELSAELAGEKIMNLTLQVEKAFGLRPLSFRSGRYGFNRSIAEILASNSYLVDSSVTPYIDWSKLRGIGAGGPDFIENGPYPFSYDFDDRELLEIPVTILPTRFPLNNNKIARKYFRNVDHSLVLKVFRKMGFSNQPIWLRPHQSMTIGLFRELLTKAMKIDLPYIVMMFHSSELMPGCSIYRPDEASVEALYKLLEEFFILLESKKIASVTMTEAAKSYKQ